MRLSIMKNRIINELIEKFLRREDISIEIAKKMEVQLEIEYPDDESAQDLVLMLASYRPGGGECLYDENDVARKLALFCARLK